MEDKKEKLADFKTAISSTVRSLSNSEKIEVSFGNENTKSEKNTIRLPDLSQIKNKLNYNQIRAMADSKSLRFRFSDVKTFKEYEPEGNISKQLYRISEKIRCEKIGTSYFKGVKNNIETFYQERISGLDLKSSEDKIVESFENYLRIKFLDFQNNKQVDKKLKSYKKDLNEKFKDKINQLNDFALNQKKFNSLISELIANMNLDENLDEEEKKDDEKNNDDKQNKPDNQEKQAKEKEDKQEEMSIDSGMPNLENDSKESDQAEEEIEIEDSSQPDLRKKGKNNLGDINYKFFTDEFDEIIKAEDLENVEELTRLRKNLDQQLLQLKNFISKLANKLQRKLTSKTK